MVMALPIANTPEKQSLKDRLYQQSILGGGLRGKYIDAANLGQIAGDESNIVGTGNQMATGLMTNYIDAYYDANKKLPTDQEVNDYISRTTSNPNTMGKLLNQAVSNNDMYSMAKNDSSIQTAQDQTQAEDLKAKQGSFEQQAGENTKTQRSLLDQIAAMQIQQYKSGAEQDYGEQRKRMLNELGAGGRAFNPNAYGAVAQADNAYNRNLQNSLAGIRGQQISSQLGVEGKSLSDIMAGRQFDVGVQQQNKGLGLQRQSLYDKMQRFYDDQANTQRENQKNRDTALAVGKAQADASKSGPLDFANTAISGLGAAANTISAFRKK